MIFAKKTIPYVHMLPSYSEAQAKKEFYVRLRREKAEGVVFKRRGAVYKQGRSTYLLKHKFTKTVDCVIIARNVDDKDNFVLAMYDEFGCLQEVGKVSALTGDGPKLKIGDVAEVTILYATNSNKLYQPVSPKLRLDKTEKECTLDQLEEMKPSKKVFT